MLVNNTALLDMELVLQLTGNRTAYQHLAKHHLNDTIFSDSCILDIGAKLFGSGKKKISRLLKEVTYFYILYEGMSDELKSLSKPASCENSPLGQSSFKTTLVKYSRHRHALHCSYSARSTIL